MRKAFEDLGALYVMFWAEEKASGSYRVAASYESKRNRRVTESNGRATAGHRCPLKPFSRHS